MSFEFKHKWAVRVVVVLAIMPLLFENAFHCLLPCTDEVSHCCAGHAHLPCDSDNAGHESGEPAPSSHSCPVCDFVATPCDVACTFTWHCVPGLVECHEPEPVHSFVVLYRPFEPGRAPPAVL